MEGGEISVTTAIVCSVEARPDAVAGFGPDELPETTFAVIQVGRASATNAPLSVNLGVERCS